MRTIIKLEHEKVPYYLEWSTVTDSPSTPGLTFEEFKEWYEEQYGKSAMLEFEVRIGRANKIGTSSALHHSADEVISGNRAGDKEKCLTKEEIIQKYIIEWRKENT